MLSICLTLYLRIERAQKHEFFREGVAYELQKLCKK